MLQLVILTAVKVNEHLSTPISLKPIVLLSIDLVLDVEFLTTEFNYTGVQSVRK